MNANQSKRNLIRPALPTLVANCLAIACVVMSACAPALAGNIYPELTINGSVHTGVSVVWATPVEVLLSWENGGGCICERQALPAELVSCYPYDPKAAEQWTQTIFPKLVMHGEVYSNVSVARFNPVELIIRWDGGGGTFKRQELPPELAERHPYDARAAEQWLCEKAASNRKLQEQNRQAAKANQHALEQQREQSRQRALQNLSAQADELRAQIRKLDKELENLNEFIPVLDGRAAGTRRNSPAHQAADRAREQKLVLIDQIHQLQQQLDDLSIQLSLNR